MTSTDKLNAEWVAATKPPKFIANDLEILGENMLTALRERDAEIERLTEGLKFYAEGNHMMQGFDHFDTVSGEPQNIECWSFLYQDRIDDGGSMDMTVENGGLARAVLENKDDEPWSQQDADQLREMHPQIPAKGKAEVPK